MFRKSFDIMTVLNRSIWNMFQKRKIILYKKELYPHCKADILHLNVSVVFDTMIALRSISSTIINVEQIANIATMKKELKLSQVHEDITKSDPPQLPFGYYSFRRRTPWGSFTSPDWRQPDEVVD